MLVMVVDVPVMVTVPDSAGGPDVPPPPPLPPPQLRLAANKAARTPPSAKRRTFHRWADTLSRHLDMASNNRQSMATAAPHHPPGRGFLGGAG